MAHPSMCSSLRRSPRGGVEQNQMADLSSHVEGSIFPNILDIWTCTLSGSGEFSVALVRNLKDDQILEEIASKNRWIKAILKKVKIHVWRVKLENLPTRLNISRRSMDLDSIFCSTCNSFCVTGIRLDLELSDTVEFPDSVVWICFGSFSDSIVYFVLDRFQIRSLD
ncbi:hypothetical protein Tco_0386223 [Tanacetum coccineum]